MVKKLKEIRESSNAKTPKLDIKMPARRSARLKSEIFVDYMPPEPTLEKEVDQLATECQEVSNIIYNKQQHKTNTQKSSTVIGKIDKYFNKQYVSSLGKHTTNSSQTTSEAEKNETSMKSKANTSKTVEEHSKDVENSKTSDNLLHLTDSFLIDSFDMIRSTKSKNLTSELQNKNSNYAIEEVFKATPKQPVFHIKIEKNKNINGEKNNLGQKKSCTNIPKNKQDSKYTNLVLLKSKSKKKFIGSQIMANNSVTSTSNKTSKLNENLQKIIENGASKPLSTSPKKRSGTRTACKRKLDHDFTKESGIKRMRRFTICVNLENNVSISKGKNDVSENLDCAILNPPQQTKLTKENVRSKSSENVLRESARIRQRRLTISNITSSKDFKEKNNLDLIESCRKNTTICKETLKSDKNISDTVDCTYLNPSQQLKSTEEYIKSNSFQSGLRKSARIRQRRLTISNLAFTSDDFEATKPLDYMESPARIRQRRLTISNITSSNDFKEKNNLDFIESCRKNTTICKETLQSDKNNISDTVDCTYLNPSQQLKSTEEYIKSNSFQSGLRKSARIRQRRLTISNLAFTSDDFEATKPLDYMESPAKKIKICKESLECAIPSLREMETPDKSTQNNRARAVESSFLNLSQEIQKTEGNTKSNSRKSNLRESARIRQRRMTISNISITSDDFKAKKNLDFIESPQEDITSRQVEKSITKDFNDKNEVAKENASTSSMLVVTTNNETSTKLQSRKVKAKNKTLEENSSTQEPKRKRARPQTTDTTPKQTVAKNQSARIALCRLSKEKLSSIKTRKIPQNRLNEVLDMIENENHPLWNDRNISCNVSIHNHYWETRKLTSDRNIKMKYARQFLLRRDWWSLSKILCLSSPDTKSQHYFPLLVKYAALCLAHTDNEQFQKFIKSLISIDDSNKVIQKCTKISHKNKG